MKRSVIFLVILTSLLYQAQSQTYILDVPYRYEGTENCSTRCWAVSAYMLLVYYGNNVEMCDIMETVRQADNSLYNTTDCCLEYDSCCSAGYLLEGVYNYKNSIETILNAWGLNCSDKGSYLTESEILTQLSQNRPFAAAEKYTYNPYSHVKVIFGYNSSEDELYAHNTGQGSEIIDYNEYIVPGVDNLIWDNTLLMGTSATSCPNTQTVVGRLKSSLDDPYLPFIYKATQNMYISCIIESTADAEFYAGNDIIIEQGFRADLGCSFFLQSGATISCP